MATLTDVVAELERLDTIVRDVQVSVSSDGNTVIRLGQVRDEVWEIIAQVKQASAAAAAAQRDVWLG